MAKCRCQNVAWQNAGVIGQNAGADGQIAGGAGQNAGLGFERLRDFFS